jgi:outer membrane protein assembly factor BamB
VKARHPAPWTRFAATPFCFAPLLLLGAAALLAGCRSDGDPVSEAVELTANTFSVDWRAEVPIGDGEIRNLYVNEDRVMAVNSDNRGFFLNRKSGHINQITRVGSVQDSVYAPLTVPSYIVFPSTSQLTVLNREGAVQHKIRMRYGVSSGAVGDDDRIFLGLDSPKGGRLVAIANRPQPYDITPLWELLTRGQVSATPAYFNGQVYASSRDGGVYAVLGETREVLWPGLPNGHFRTGGGILADLKADKDSVYVASMDTKLYALDHNTGRVKWRYYAGRPLRENSSPIVTADTVYLFVPGQGLVAIDKNNRNEIRPAKWVVENARQFLAQDDQHVYVQMSDNRITAVDRHTGEPRFVSNRRDFVRFAVNTTPADNTIYAATRNGTVYAIRPVLKPGGVGELVMAE